MPTIPSGAIDGELAPAVVERLDFELSVINKLGFANYFLIVWDFVRYCARAGHSGHGPRQRRRLARFLRAVSEPRLPAAVRLAVRAVPGRKPQGSARYRHRLLQGPPRRRDSIRQGQVRRSERGPDRHVRHAGRAGRDSRRRPGAGLADSARRRHRGHGARGTAHHARQGARSRAPI